MAGERLPVMASIPISRCSTQWGCRKAHRASPFLSSPPKVAAAKPCALIGCVKGKPASPWPSATWKVTGAVWGCTWRCNCASNKGAKPSISADHCWHQAGTKGGYQVCQEGTEKYQIMCAVAVDAITLDSLGNQGHKEAVGRMRDAWTDHPSQWVRPSTADHISAQWRAQGAPGRQATLIKMFCLGAKSPVWR